jgi:glycosyltransferase involved in cell wall biosynthesis
LVTNLYKPDYNFIKNEKVVSVIMPLYNEDEYINECILSLLNQDFPKENMEWIFIDGGSKDMTVDIIKKYEIVYPEMIQLYFNPNKTVPYAMNIGIHNSNGKYIIRMDAHSKYANDYISKCVYYLENTNADNVGGIVETKSKTFIGEVMALMLSSPFGVGNSTFRIGGKNGEVDTVPFGAFRREVFEKWGYYDERLTRNQDNEMNYRIRKNGGKILLTNDINLTYYSRETFQEMMKMACKNGRWNIITMYLCPGSMGMRHFIPFIFVLSLIIGIINIIFFNLVFVKFLFIFEILLYLLLNIIFSLKSTRNKTIKHFCLLLICYPVFHISYGIGSFIGVYKILIGKEFQK